jgi:TonB family protein
MSSSTGPPATSACCRERIGRRRRAASSLLLSLLFHVVVAVIVGLPALESCEQKRLDGYGSRELDVDLVQPRLAPPLEDWGQLEDKPGRALAAFASDGRQRGRRSALCDDDRPAVDLRRDPRRRGPSQPEWEISRPPEPTRAAQQEAEQKKRDARQRVEAQQDKEEKRASDADQARRAQAAREAQARARQPKSRAPQVGEQSAPRRAGEDRARLTPLLAAEAGEMLAPEHRDQRADLSNEQRPDGRPGQRKARAELDAERPARLAALPTAEHAGAALLQLPSGSTTTAAEETVPDGPSPTALLASVTAEAAQRHRQHARALAASRRRFAEAERAFTAMTQQTGRVTHCLAGSFEGAAVGAEGRDAQGQQDAHGGRAPRYGLKFYLSGRRVEHSRVVVPPELLQMPKVQCKVVSLMITPATVRMLVETTGKVGHAYLKRSSGSKRFDRCAMQHARKMLFKPGTDATGVPLNVWINLRVEPGTLSAGL